MRSRAAKLNGAGEVAFNSDAFFTPSTLASRWHRHTESVRRLLRRRSLPSIIIGRQRLIPRAAVLAFEANGLILASTVAAENGGAK